MVSIIGHCYIYNWNTVELVLISTKQINYSDIQTESWCYFKICVAKLCLESHYRSYKESKLVFYHKCINVPSMYSLVTRCFLFQCLYDVDDKLCFSLTEAWYKFWKEKCLNYCYVKHASLIVFVVYCKAMNWHMICLFPTVSSRPKCSKHKKTRSDVLGFCILRSNWLSFSKRQKKKKHK